MDVKIVEKIKKLLSLSGSPNEHEAQSALLKAQELLAKYQLSMSDLEIQNETKEEVVEVSVEATLSRTPWKGRLAIVIAENFRCYSWLVKGHRSSYIVFLGNSSDVEICKLTLDFALKFIQRRSNQIGRKLNKEGYSSKGVLNSYGAGFVGGLNAQFSEQKSQNEKWELALAQPQKATEIYNGMDFKFKESHVKINKKYEAIGYEDGKNFCTNALDGNQTNSKKIS